MLTNTHQRYGSVSQFFHWTIFFLMALMIICGFVMEDLPKSWQAMVYLCHKSTGLLILGLVVARLLWRWANKTPTLPNAMPGILKAGARIIHALLYLVLFALPLSGWIMSTAAGRIPTFYGLITIPFPGIEPNKQLAENALDAHEILVFIFLSLLVLHVLAALKHHFIDHDDILRRMLPEKWQKKA